MPTYTYKCAKCLNVSEVRQSISEAPLTVCENCGGELKKVLGQISVSFKGSGFYRTDNSSGKSES